MRETLTKKYKDQYRNRRGGNDYNIYQHNDDGNQVNEDCDDHSNDL